MAALYLLLPDRREERVEVVTRIALAHYNASAGDKWQPYFRPVTALGPIGAWVTPGRIDPDDMLALLRQIDWAYPARVLYRTESENTWSFVTLGLSLRELGEAG
ncbi:MAG: hypothetical protein ACTHON_18170 [Humibacter sp.]